MTQLRPSRSLPALLAASSVALGSACTDLGARPLAAARYRIVDLGEVSAMALNDSGMVAGAESVGFGWRAVVTDGRTPRAVGPAGAKESHGYGINDRGEVVGTWTSARDNIRAFAWRGGRVTDLGTFPEAWSGWANAVNERGTIVGGGVEKGGDYAWVWENGRMRHLEGFFPRGGGRADRLNDAGWMVGAATLAAGGKSHAALWKGAGRPLDLGTLGGSESYASGINSAGAVVGWARAADGVQHAFVWRNGRMTDLTPRGLAAEAKGINDAGAVVGWASKGEGQARAVIWEGGQIRYLDEMLPLFSGWRRLSEAKAVNNRGQIIGSGYVGREPHDFLLTPVR